MKMVEILRNLIYIYNMSTTSYLSWADIGRSFKKMCFISIGDLFKKTYVNIYKYILILDI